MISLSVYYEDTDAGGVVHHAAYVRFFERGRSEWLREQGFEQSALAEAGVLFAVRRLSVEYKLAATLDDKLTVETTPARRTRSALLFSQQIRRDKETLATAEVLVVCVTPAPFRAAPLPPPLAAAVDGAIKGAALYNPPCNG